MKQDELMGDIDSIVLRSEGTTVRQILKIPEELFELVELVGFSTNDLAIRQFVKEVKDGKIGKGDRKALHSAFNEGGGDAVEKLLKLAFLGYSTNFVSDEDKQRNN
ncbi:hypothetical protein F8M41_006379 [Gigaspora margarita]|uniref:Uncharacterized protein n=1 Tax=Gigaspora margarita TaxID=4874 RepID=A0A8H3X7X0_GIGMA|nr:hypothetical protein F8M41_006379 [Gigaspora margarita]